MALTVDEQKKRLRKRFISERNALSANDVFSNSRFISSRLINTKAYVDAEIVHCYVSINKQNEVETRNLIQHMLDHGKNVVVPKMEGNGLLSHYYIHSLEELTENSWGVAEPASDDKNSALVDNFDIIIVPMVSGDVHKNRLGYGKGYYDRFLEGIKATKIGFLFDVQLCKNRLPTDKFDIQLDMLITESKIVV